MFRVDPGTKVVDDVTEETSSSSSEEDDQIAPCSGEMIRVKKSMNRMDSKVKKAKKNKIQYTRQKRLVDLRDMLFFIQRVVLINNFILYFSCNTSKYHSLVLMKNKVTKFFYTINAMLLKVAFIKHLLTYLQAVS